MEAYETLIDPAQRRRYDLTLQPARPALRHVPVEPMVSSAEPMTRTPYYQPRRPAFDDLMDEIFRSFDDFFGPTAFRW